MCLIINPVNVALEAETDIVCWKFLEIVNYKKGKFKTPYKNFPVKIGKTYTSKLVKEGKEVNVGIHSFVKIEDALDYQNGYGRVVAKCIIPKGSMYFLGAYDLTDDSYASDKLKYVCLVDGEGNDIVNPTFMAKVKKFFS